MDQCTCPGELIRFQCTAIGPGTTLYKVTGCPDDRLNLLHTGFADGTADRDCRNGDVTARGVQGDTNTMTFISQLNFSYPTDQYVTVGCYYGNGSHFNPVGIRNLTIGMYLVNTSIMRDTWSGHLGLGSSPRKVLGF